ncbi:NAD(P)-dependent oxidoreductase [Sphingomonas sp. ID0503]|uniref:NAD(P)-dependent oxidoreductase n=1 Tax=Sphingomonas sp. ID0503 TaxID=3399691 RepID=UPI003AFB6D40
MAKVTFLGLGVMGAPMARHLTATGHDVTVYNRTGAKAEAWVAAHGGRAAATPAEAAEGAEAVFSCVGADHDLEAVTLGPDGCFAVMAEGALFVDHTTVSADIARRLAVEGAARGLRVLDAPISGGQAGAEGGTLTIMCGGAVADYEAAVPMMQAYGKRITRIGEAGAGQLAKMCNQVAIAGLVQGLAELVGFAKAAGLDTGKVFEAISGGAASSWQMLNRWETMADGKFDFGFAVDWMRKDLGLTLDEARRNGASLPVAALVDQFYGEVQAMGGGRNDTSSLVRRLVK